MSDGTQRDIGRLEGQMEVIIAQMTELNKQVSEMRQDVSRAKGGWSVLLAIGGIAGAIGALVGKFLPFIPIR